MTPDDIRERLEDAHSMANQSAGPTDDRAIVVAIGALTEAVLHLADIIGRDRVF